MTTTKTDEFIKDICRTVGHEWKYRQCSRCGGTQPLMVYRNGTLQLPGVDYIEYTVGQEARITLTNQTGEGEHLTVTYSAAEATECRISYVINAGESVSFKLPV